MAYIDTKYLGKCETCRHHVSGGCNTYCDHGEEYSPNLFKIPTADVVEVKHGEWIEEGNKHTCSCCGYCHILFGIPKHKYCQNCGAKMYIERKEK